MRISHLLVCLQSHLGHKIHKLWSLISSRFLCDYIHLQRDYNTCLLDRFLNFSAKNYKKEKKAPQEVKPQLTTPAFYYLGRILIGPATLKPMVLWWTRPIRGQHTYFVELELHLGNFYLCCLTFGKKKNGTSQPPHIQIIREREAGKSKVLSKDKNRSVTVLGSV